MNCHFPKISEQPISWFRDPYKVFALNPVALLVWRAVQIAGTFGAFGPKDSDALMGVDVTGLTLNGCLNVGCRELISKRSLTEHSSRLQNAVWLTVGLHIMNFLEVVSYYELNHRLGNDALFVRVAVIATTVFLMCVLISYANKDEPHLGNLIERESYQAAYRLHNNEDETGDV